MKTYILEVTLPEGNDEFWEDVAKGKARTKVKDAIKQTLDNEGWFDAKVKIVDVITHVDG